jgi:hypothetical protein
LYRGSLAALVGTSFLALGSLTISLIAGSFLTGFSVFCTLGFSDLIFSAFSLTSFFG